MADTRCQVLTPCTDYETCCWPHPCAITKTRPTTFQYLDEAEKEQKEPWLADVVFSEFQEPHCEICGGPCLRRPRHGENGL